MYPAFQELHAEVQKAILESLGVNKDDIDDPVLRQVTNLASKTLKVPGVIINFVLPDEQITISGTVFGSNGFMENYRMPREDSVCRIMIDEKVDEFQATDLRTNEKTKLLPIVTASIKSLFHHKKFKYNEIKHGVLTDELVENQQKTLQFYYGTKLKVGDSVVGAVCALDTKPRPDWTQEQKQILKGFAKIVSSYLLQRRKWQKARKRRAQKPTEDSTSSDASK